MRDLVTSVRHVITRTLPDKVFDVAVSPSDGEAFAVIRYQGMRYCCIGSVSPGSTTWTRIDSRRVTISTSRGMQGRIYCVDGKRQFHSVNEARTTIKRMFYIQQLMDAGRFILLDQQSQKPVSLLPPTRSLVHMGAIGVIFTGTIFALITLIRRRHM